MLIVTRYIVFVFVLVFASPAFPDDNSVYITDRAITAALERGGAAMLADGNAVKNEDLRAQLDRTAAALTPPDEGSLASDGEDIYDCATDGVIVVAGIYLCGRCDNHHARCATGFVATADGVAVTNHHVVDNPDNLTLIARTRDGRIVPVTEVLATSKADDVSLIRLGGDGPYKPLPIARTAEVGQRVHTISHPSGRFYCYSAGEVARFFLAHNHGGPGTPNAPGIKRIQITAPFAKGSSGGPILNDAGQVIAIVTTTDSVYYSEENGQQRNLQMTFYNTVPFDSILKLFGTVKENSGPD